MELIGGGSVINGATPSSFNTATQMLQAIAAMFVLACLLRLTHLTQERHYDNTLCEEPLKKSHLEFASPSGDY